MFVIDPKGVLVYNGAIDDKSTADLADVPGAKTYGLEFPDQPVLAIDRVRYFGEAVVLVAAEHPEGSEPRKIADLYSSFLDTETIERLGAARALADRGESAEAERLVAEALEADPLPAAARELRGLLLLELGDDEGAESELRAALFLEPDRALAQA
ncbi:MAG: hypothetical protein ABR611_16120, partial [Chthoniobacterales bacterium]